MDGQGLRERYLRIPRFTRTLLTTFFFVTLLAFLRLVDPSKLALDWTLVFREFHLWRPFTNCLFVGPFSLRWLLYIVMFCQFSSYLENVPDIAAPPGRYLYFLTLQMLLLSAVSALFFWPAGWPRSRAGSPYLADSLAFAIIYYWSRRDRGSVVSIYQFKVQAHQVPFALMFLHLVMGSSLIVDFLGVISGHAFYLVNDWLPTKGRRARTAGYPNYLARTPWVFDYVARKLDGLYARAVPGPINWGPFTQFPPRHEAPPRNSGFVGRGRRLGGD